MPRKSKCCVPDCISHKAKSKLAFHKFPTNKLIAEKWLQTFAQSKLKPFKCSRICGRHFERHQYKNLQKNILKKGVIPLLFMPKRTSNVSQTNLETVKCVEHTTLVENSTKLDEISSESSVKLYDFNKTCRICLLEKPDLQNMDSEVIQNLFLSSDILNFSATDTLAKHICGVCLAELRVVYSFSMKCGKSSDIFRNYAAKSTSSEQITNSTKKSLSKTVEISYVPSDAEQRSEDTPRTYKYKLVAVDNIQKPSVSSLVSLARLKTTSARVETPVLTSTVQAFEVQSSEIQKPSLDSQNNESSLKLDDISPSPSGFTRNNSSLEAKTVLVRKDLPETKSSSYKRTLLKRKSKTNATVEARGAGLPSKTQKLLATARNLVLNPFAQTSVANVIQEKVVHHSRSARRQSRLLSRTAGRISRSRRSRSRSIRSRSSTRLLRYSTRKKVASGNALYWYDKPSDSAVNQMKIGGSKALENENGGLEQLDTSTESELLGFNKKDESMDGEMQGNRDGNSIMDDTAKGSTGSDEKTAGSVKTNGLAERNASLAERKTGLAKRKSGLAERNIGTAKTSGLAERNAGSAEKNAGLDERKAGLVETTAGSRKRNAGAAETNGAAERNAGSVERTAGLAERIIGLAETTAGSVERNPVLAERNAVLAETTGTAERNAFLAERNAGSVERTAGLAERKAVSAERIVGSDKTSADSIETTAQSVMNAHSIMVKLPIKQNTTILQCQPTNINIGEEITNTVVNIPKRGRGRPRKYPVLLPVKLETVCIDTSCIDSAATQPACKNDKCKRENDNTNNLIPKNEKCNGKNDNTNNLILKNEKCNIKIENTNNLIPKNEKCIVKIDNTNNLIPKNEKCNLKIDNTNNLIPKNEKCIVKIDNTNNLIPKNEKCIVKNDNTNNLIPKNEKGNIKIENLIPKNEKYNTDNSITTNGNTKPGNRVKPATKKFKCAKRNTKLGTAATNIENNSTLIEKQPSLPVSKTIIGHTAEHLPTEELTSSKDNQPKSNKITKPTETSTNVVENEAIYMKLRHKNVKFSPASRKRKSHSNVNIKHLHISKQEYNKMLNVKLELNKYEVKYSKKKASDVTKKVKMFNNTTSDNSRVLRSSKSILFGNEKTFVIHTGESLTLARKALLENLKKQQLNRDKSDINIKTGANDSGLQEITLNVKSHEDVQPTQLTSLDNTGGVDKMADNCSTITTLKDETGLKDITDQETSEPELANTFVQISANVNEESCKNMKTELDKCSPDTTTKVDTCSLDSEADLPKTKLENEGLLTITEDKSSVGSKPEIDSQITISEHSYCLVENLQECKTECSPHAIEQNSSVNNETELEKTPENKPTVDNTDNDSKSELIDLLYEFVVFDQDHTSADELADVPTEEYSTNYYQLLDGTNSSLTEDAQVINSDAMLSNVLKLSPELKPGQPTVYEPEMNDSFEISINNILNTEYNSVCDGQLVGAGIVLEDVGANEEVQPTEEPEGPKFRVNCEGVYFNKHSGMIVTSVPVKETSNYASEDENYSSRFHSAWVPVKPVTESPRILLETVETPATSTADNNGSVPAVEPNFYQCEVCKTVCDTKEELNWHTVYANHITKRFCKYCKLWVDVTELDAHLKRHENEVYCCEYCGEMVYELKNFLRHCRIHRRHTCQLCPMEFETKFLLREHLTIHIGARRDQCRFCLKHFGRISALIKHLAARTCLKKEKFICTVCKKIFNTKKKAMQHVKQHQRFKCNICNRIFSSEKFCLNHLKLVHGITETIETV